VSIRIAFLLLTHPFTGSSQVNAPLFAIDRSHVGSKFSPHRTTPPSVPYGLILPINTPSLAPSLTPPHHLSHPIPSLPSPPVSKFQDSVTSLPQPDNHPSSRSRMSELKRQRRPRHFLSRQHILRLLPSILDSRTKPKL
jgi:hypothetical protein